MSGQSDAFISLLRQVQLFSELSDADLRQITENAVMLRRSEKDLLA